MKIKLLLSSILCIVLSSKVGWCQYPAWQWAFSGAASPIGNNFYNEVVNDVVHDAQGNVYVTGGFSSMGGLNLDGTTITSDALGNSDAFVAKFDNQGSLLWVKSFGGTTHDMGHKIILDGQGNIITAGIVSPSLSESVSIGTVSINGTLVDNRYTLYVAKLNPFNGNTVWATGSNSNTFNFLTVKGLGVDNNNNVYVGGDYYGAALTMGPASCNATSNQYYYFKLNTSGVPQFGRTIGNGTNEAAAMAVDANGNVFIAGDNQSDITISGQPIITMLPGNNSTNLYLVKYNSNGIFQFMNRYASSDAFIGQAEATALAVNSAGEVLLAGLFYKNILNQGDPNDQTSGIVIDGNTYTSAGGSEPILLHFDNAGILLNATQLEGSDNDLVTDITTDGSGRFYITGNYKSSTLVIGNGTTLFNAGSSDIFLAGYDNSLNPFWFKTNVGADNAQAISVSANGYSVWSGGSFSGGSAYFDALQVSNSGVSGNSFDLYISKLGVCVKNAVTATASTNDTVCWDETVTLTADTGFVTYIWNSGATGISFEEYALQGDFTVTATDEAGCMFTSSPVTIVRRSKPDVIITSNLNFDYCDIQTNGYVTTTENFSSYQWFVNFEPGSTSDTLAVEGSSTYLVRVTDEYGCEAESDTVTFTELPSPTATPIDGSILVNVQDVESYSTSAQNGTIFWIVTGGTLIDGQGSETVTIQWDSAGIGTIELNVSNQSCGVIQNLSVTVELPVSLSSKNYSKLNLFPNPASENVMIKDIVPGTRIILMSLDGKQVAETIATNSNVLIPIGSLAAGTYQVCFKDGETYFAPTRLVKW